MSTVELLSGLQLVHNLEVSTRGAVLAAKIIDAEDSSVS